MKGKSLITSVQLATGAIMEVRLKAIPSYWVISVKRTRKIGKVWFSLSSLQVVGELTGSWTQAEIDGALYIAKKHRSTLYPEFEIK